MASSISVPLPELILITDWALGAPTLLARLAEALAVSPRIAVQHRHPQVTARQFLAEAEQLAELCARAGNPLFVNGRLDVALLVEAHLHLPAQGLRPADVRNHLPADRLISAAVHSAAEAADAKGASFALLSPVFPPTSKPKDDRPPLGVAGFEALASSLAFPCFALGGVTPQSAEEIPKQRGLAVLGSVLHAADPAKAAAALLGTRGR
jgi:thiamine-phosphate pyrophosphorylase